MKYVKSYRDRHGRMRHYFYRLGKPQVPLPGDPASAEFLAAYNAALAASGPVRENRTKRIEHTLRGMIRAFDHMRHHAPRVVDVEARDYAEALLCELANGNAKATDARDDYLTDSPNVSNQRTKSIV